MTTQQPGKFSIEQHRIKAQSSEIDSIYNSLNETTEKNISVIPEEIFVNNFLPLFAGEKAPDEVSLSLWFGVAGNPYMPVKVVDKTGEVLYTIPAFFDRDAVRIDKATKEATPIAHIVKTAEQLAKIHPKRAERYFEEQMGRRNIVNPDSVQTQKNTQVWVEIFKRYGKELPAYMNTSNAQSLSSPTQSEEKSPQDDKPESWDML